MVGQKIRNTGAADKQIEECVGNNVTALFLYTGEYLPLSAWVGFLSYQRVWNFSHYDISIIIPSHCGKRHLGDTYDLVLSNEQANQSEYQKIFNKL